VTVFWIEPQHDLSDGAVSLIASDIPGGKLTAAQQINAVCGAIDFVARRRADDYTTSGCR